MKRIVKRINIYTGHITRVILVAVFIIFSTNLYSSAQFDTWGISKEKVMKEYISSNEKTEEFKPSERPDYENKIMNMVKLILQNVDNDVYEKIKIVSTKTNPRRDFLLFNNKLFSIMEYYDSISKDSLNNVVNNLSKAYGEPNHNPGDELDIYFISSKNTKIIVHYFIKTKKCEIYFYDSQLYHKLSSNEY